MDGWKMDLESGAVPDLTPRWRVNLNGPHSQSFIILIKRMLYAKKYVKRTWYKIGS